MAVLNRLEIETRVLQSDIEELKAQLKIMRETGDSMMSEINGLSAMWEGEAKMVFTEQFRRDRESLKEMENVVETLIGNLEKARQRYDSCESSVGSIISSLRV